jgi:hypothetical protein
MPQMKFSDPRVMAARSLARRAGGLAFEAGVPLGVGGYTAYKTHDAGVDPFGAAALGVAAGSAAMPSSYRFALGKARANFAREAARGTNPSLNSLMADELTNIVKRKALLAGAAIIPSAVTSSAATLGNIADTSKAIANTAAQVESASKEMNKADTGLISHITRGAEQVTRPHFGLIHRAGEMVDNQARAAREIGSNTHIAVRALNQLAASAQTATGELGHVSKSIAGIGDAANAATGMLDKGIGTLDKGVDMLDKGINTLPSLGLGPRVDRILDTAHAARPYVLTGLAGLAGVYALRKILARRKQIKKARVNETSRDSIVKAARAIIRAHAHEKRANTRVYVPAGAGAPPITAAGGALVGGGLLAGGALAGAGLLAGSLVRPALGAGIGYGIGHMLGKPGDEADVRRRARIGALLGGGAGLLAPNLPALALAGATGAGGYYLGTR